MHSLLDTYLKEVAGHLAGLPTARRTEEIREVRTHLENAVIVGQEMGQSEDEAARDALTQFGTSGELSENLVWVWRREQGLNRRSLFGAAVFTVGALFFLYFLFTKLLLIPFMALIAHSLGHSVTDAPFPAVCQWSSVVLRSLGPILVGAMSAILFRRKAFSGAVLGVIVFSCYCWATLGISANTHLGHLGTLFFINYAIDNEQLAFAVLCAAWVVSWRRTAGQRRRYQAAAK